MSVARRALVVRALAISVLVAAVLATAATTTADAHSALRSSDPPDQAQVDEAPDEVELVFTEAPDPALSKVSVYDQTGEAIVDNEKMVPDAGDSETVRVALPPLEDGLFTVSWQALSSVDGHVTTGAFSFTVGEPTEGDDEVDDEALAALVQTEGGSVGASSEPLGVAGRWLLYAGLALLFGWALSALVVFREPPTRWTWALPLCWGVAALGFVVMMVAEASSIDTSVRSLLASTAGTRLWRIIIGLGAVAVGVVAATAIRRRPMLAAALLAVLTAGAMYTYVLSGHAGAPGDLRWLNVASQWVHVLAIGAWIGGLWWLIAGLRARPDSPRLSSVLRFSLLATVSLGFVVLTGVVRAIEGIGSWSALWETRYGVTFLIKMGLVLALVSLGAMNRFRHIPAMRRDGGGGGALRKAVGGEVAFAVVVFGVTGFLATTPPPVDIEDELLAHDEHEAEMEMEEHLDDEDHLGEEEEEGIIVEGSDFGTSVRVTLHIEPGAIGPNEFSVRVADYDSDEAVNASSVVLHFSVPGRGDVGPTVLELQPADDGSWEAESTVLAFPDEWRALAVIVASPDGYEIPLDFGIGVDVEEDEDDSGEDDMDDMDGGHEEEGDT